MATDSIERRLIVFVAERLVKGIESLELVHCTDGGESLIRQYQIDRSDAEAGQLAGEILNEAADHTECYPMPQRFSVQAFMGNNNVHCGQCQFLLRPSKNARNPLGGLTEPPTERGLIAQLMRHTEAAYSANIELSRAIATMHQARAETAETSFNRYVAERERWAGFSAEEAQRAHERKMQELEATRDHEIVKAGLDELKPMIHALAPPLARKFERFLEGGTKRRPGPPPAAPAPGLAPSEDESASEDSTPPDGQAAPSEPQDIDREKARRAELQAVLSEITEEEAAKIEEVLGREKASRLVRAAVDML